MPDSFSDPAGGSTPTATLPEWQRLADDPEHPLRQLDRRGTFLEPVDPDPAKGERVWRWYHHSGAWQAIAVFGLAVALLVVVLIVQPWRNLADEIAGVPYNVGRLLDRDTWGER